MSFVYFDVFFYPAELAELRLDTDAFLVGAVDDALGDGDIFLKDSWLASIMTEL